MKKELTTSPSRYVSLKDAARITGLTTQTIRNYCRNEYIECTKVGIKKWMVGIDVNSSLCFFKSEMKK